MRIRVLKPEAQTCVEQARIVFAGRARYAGGCTASSEALQLTSDGLLEARDKTVEFFYSLFPDLESRSRSVFVSTEFEVSIIGVYT